jgi:aspartate-semialdehyde dehydrogenase
MTDVVMTLAMYPIVRRFGVKDCIATTLQALSGAGPHGISSLQIVDNLIPYVKLEEEKLRDEGAKIFGRFEAGRIVSHPMRISSTCTRVGVSDGHVAAVSLACERPAPLEEIKETLDSFRGEAQDLGLPSAPRKPIYLTEEIDRPQPRLDRNVEGGMAVVVGRVREEPVLSNGVKSVVCGHNKARGTAGNTLLCAELLYAKKLLDG